MPPKKSKLHLGKDTHCWGLLTKIRPSQDIDKKFPNKEARVTCNDLIAMHCGTHKQCRKSFPALWFTSATLPDIDWLLQSDLFVFSQKDLRTGSFTKLSPPHYLQLPLKVPPWKK